MTRAKGGKRKGRGKGKVVGVVRIDRGRLEVGNGQRLESRIGKPATGKSSNGVRKYGKEMNHGGSTVF